MRSCLQALAAVQAHSHGVYALRTYYVRQGEKDLFKGAPQVLEVVHYRVIRFLPSTHNNPRPTLLCLRCRTL